MFDSSFQVFISFFWIICIWSRSFEFLFYFRLSTKGECRGCSFGWLLWSMIWINIYKLACVWVSLTVIQIHCIQMLICWIRLQVNKENCKSKTQQWYKYNAWWILDEGQIFKLYQLVLHLWPIPMFIFVKYGFTKCKILIPQISILTRHFITISQNLARLLNFKR